MDSVLIAVIAELASECGWGSCGAESMGEGCTACPRAAVSIIDAGTFFPCTLRLSHVSLVVDRVDTTPCIDGVTEVKAHTAEVQRCANTSSRCNCSSSSLESRTAIHASARISSSIRLSSACSCKWSSCRDVEG